MVGVVGVLDRLEEPAERRPVAAFIRAICSQSLSIGLVMLSTRLSRISSRPVDGEYCGCESYGPGVDPGVVRADAVPEYDDPAPDRIDEVLCRRFRVSVLLCSCSDVIFPLKSFIWSRSARIVCVLLLLLPDATLGVFLVDSS